MQPEIEKKSLKTLFIGFKVVQGHRCWYPGKLVSSASEVIFNVMRSINPRFTNLLTYSAWWYAASLRLSATILLLDWSTVAEIARFEGGTQIW